MREDKMQFSLRTKVILFGLLVILGVVFRYPIVPHEIGHDSFLVHAFANSISERGYASWWFHPLSIAGFYPLSEVSAVPFMLSGIQQCTGTDLETPILIYCMFLGLFSIFTSYLMAGALWDNDAFKFLVAFCFSTSQGVLTFTSMTVPARGLFVMLTPLFIYFLLKSRKFFVRCGTLALILFLLLFTTHHMIFFLILVISAYFIVLVGIKLNNLLERNGYARAIERYVPLFPVVGFAVMYSIPIFTGHFLESSRYDWYQVLSSYARYAGILTVIFALGGLTYLVFKQRKSFGEWFLLSTVIFLTAIIYQVTYMKWFMPIVMVLLTGVSLMNVLRLKGKRGGLYVVTIFLISLVAFSGFYQFLHTYRESPYSKRYMEDSTFSAALYMKEYSNGSSIANERWCGRRMLAISNSRIFIESEVLSNVQGFTSIKDFEYEIFPITSDEFWLDVYHMKNSPAEGYWDSILRSEYEDLIKRDWYNERFNLTYIIENTRTHGNLFWHHGLRPSKLLSSIYQDKSCIYDNGNVNIWFLKEM